jgi:hypothetical protein
VGKLPGGSADADDLPIIFPGGVESEPIKARARQLASVLERLGQPLDGPLRRKLDEALAETDPIQAVRAIQHVLDPLCLVGININPESRVKVARGPAAALLSEQAWRVFLIKVHNEAGVTAPLRVTSPNAALSDLTSAGSQESKTTPAGSARWLAVTTFDQPPMAPHLSGLALDYRVLQLYSREAGHREATLAFDVGQGTQDLGFRSEVPILFKCQRAEKVIKPVGGQGEGDTGARRHDSSARPSSAGPTRPRLAAYGPFQNDCPSAAPYDRNGAADRRISQEAYDVAWSSRRDGN